MTNPPIEKGEIERLIAELQSRLQERLKLKYVGDCKCDSCQLVPAALIEEADTAFTVLLTQLSEAEAAGIERAAKLLDQKLSDYVQECGMYDPSTGQTEFSDGGEYAHTLEELAEDVRALALPKEGTSHEQ